MSHLRLGAATALVVVSLGCSKSSDNQVVAVPAEPVSTHRIVNEPAEPADDAGPSDEVPEGQAPSFALPGRGDGGCGCEPCEPIKSTDSCTTVADCAPSQLCHAPACIARSKAPVRPDGGVMCTMSLECKTIDVGRCDCVDGVCALVAR